jgi:predicted RNase H-like HicB family nuclease
MQKVRIVYWKDDHDGMWIGYLESYPDYWTQGHTLEELKDNLKDLFKDINEGSVPNIRTVEEIVI